MVVSENSERGCLALWAWSEHCGSRTMWWRRVKVDRKQKEGIQDRTRTRYSTPKNIQVTYFLQLTPAPAFHHLTWMWPAQAGCLFSLPSAATTFVLACVSDPKPKKRNGGNCLMAIVVIYLILLSAGAVLLVVQGKGVWVLCSTSWRAKLAPLMQASG